VTTPDSGQGRDAGGKFGAAATDGFTRLKGDSVSGHHLAHRPGDTMSGHAYLRHAEHLNRQSELQWAKVQEKLAAEQERLSPYVWQDGQLDMMPRPAGKSRE
jgi:hypothetical protein